jgi:serine protease AprX
MARLAADTSNVRGNALWGKGGRGSKTLAGLTVVASLLVAGLAPAEAATAKKPFVSKTLLNAAAANPAGVFDVVLSGARGTTTNDVLADLRPLGAVLGKKFPLVSSVSARLPGKAITLLATDARLGAITPNYSVARTSYSNPQLWPDAAQLTSFWSSNTTPATIAVVDSGVDATHPDLAGHVLTQVDFVTSGTNTSGDGRGHGTFVAGTAVGSADGHAGAIPTGKVVSLDVLADDGTGTLSDVLAATQWIFDNKGKYGIRVANFSLNAGSGSSFLYDPLDQAVEKLWLNGVTVVVAAGNYGSTSGASRVKYAPANDPLVITVGASDPNGTVAPNDDFAAPWSAWGYTYDGFLKPDLAAPGRVVIGPVPASSTMAQLHPERLTEPGYMWLSGTSISAPMVSAAAAQLVGQHPDWTADQVKGALMLKAAAPSGSTRGPLGVGVLQAFNSTNANGKANPNAGLDQFVSVDSATGLTAFNGDAWKAAAAANASWDSASWDSASWSSASWDSASWASASWDSASWDSASWDSASWESASWDSASWDSASWESSTWVK